MPNFNSIGSGVSEPQVAENRHLPLTGGIALTTVYALTCYTVILPQSFLFRVTQCNLSKVARATLRYQYRKQRHQRPDRPSRTEQKEPNYISICWQRWWDETGVLLNCEDGTDVVQL